MGYKTAPAPSWEGRSFLEQFQQQTKTWWLVQDWPPPCFEAQHSGCGRWSSWPGATQCLPLPSSTRLTTAWGGAGQLCSTSARAMPSFFFQAGSCGIRPQGSSEIATAASQTKEKKLKRKPKQRLCSHWHKYHTNACAQAASTHTGTWGPWIQGLKDTVTIFGHRLYGIQYHDESP